MLLNKPGESITRTYVAVCYKSDFSGYYFRRFFLPEHDDDRTPLDNNTTTAAWYFLNRLNFVACIEGCCTWEDYNNIKVESAGNIPNCPNCRQNDEVYYYDPLNDMSSFKCRRCFGVSFLP